MVSKTGRAHMYGYYDMAVIGLRNEAFQDDSFGIRVARRLKELNIEPIDVIEAAESELAGHLARYRTAVVVYSFHDAENGEVIEMDLRAGRETVTSLPPRGAKLPDALLRWQANAPTLPELIKVYCVPQAALTEVNGLRPAAKGVRVSAVIKRILHALGIELTEKAKRQK
jgi:Ni,Fe-hydrogenase maturation factor